MKWRIVWVASFRSRLWIHKRQNLLSIAIAGQHLSIIRQVYGLCFHPNRRFSHVICCFVSYPDSGLGSKHRKWINIALSYYIKHSAAPVWLLTYKFDVARPACSMGCLGEGSPPPRIAWVRPSALKHENVHSTGCRILLRRPQNSIWRSTCSVA